ncbi:kinase domain protein (macronuclear) [Tetrahymena thermophila SB210]|uniref:Kinase domain protein n=1 Tax=Tetrahymena thermophila (strain SB210) TaxID=312017 RepID=I7MMH2_TETTS|nr:kinase domain protein [Tetrahymena thermophila SB210]EAS04850.2 kinase domain protein [Tetrahymena thermophila SB210]|eukprot:XP_001025095.2 kinase domain protein [Tetrahymena thermophila SB210]
MSDQTTKKIDKYQFNLNQRIGSGSYANVYKGEDRETGKAVAIKMIDRKKISQEDYLMNGLLQEIQIMKKLDSNYIVKLIDVLETKNNYYIVQEFCDQGDFRNYLKQKGYLPEQEAKQVLVDILNGFLELLKHGIIHRDLKPENILIQTKNPQTGERIFKLADFGFSRTVDNFRRELLTSLVGTPLYMSPQILMFKKYTSKSDIWSIGLIMYEMLYGKTPWNAISQYQLVEMINKQPINWKSENIISEEAINFMYKCLQLEEEKRIQWDEIYAHPLFGDHFVHFLEKNKNLEDKALYLINNLRQKIHSTNTDLMQLFKYFDLTNDSKLTIKEFEQLMKQIDKDLNREEIEYIFNKFDSDGDNKIDFTEFQKWLEHNNIRLSINNSQQNRRKMIDQQLDQEVKQLIQKQQQQPPNLVYTHSQFSPLAANQPHIDITSNSKFYQNHATQDKQIINNGNNGNQIKQQPQQQNIKVSQAKQYDSEPGQNSSDESKQKQDISQSQRKLSPEEKAIFAIGKLKLAIDQYKINNKELFNRYDKSQQDAIQLSEFTRMIKKIDDKLQDEEIAIAFQKFDYDNSGKITFKKFDTTLANIGNSIVIQVKQKQKQTSSQKSLSDVKDNFSQPDSEKKQSHQKSNSGASTDSNKEYQQFSSAPTRTSNN